MKWIPLTRKILFVLFAGCYLVSIFCITDIIPLSHNYHYFFYAGSAFLLMFNLSFFLDYRKSGPEHRKFRVGNFRK